MEEEQVAPSPIVPTSVAGGVAAVKGLKRSPLARVEEEVALEEGSYVAKGGVREQSGGVAGWTGAEGEDEKEASFIAEEEEADVTRLGWGQGRAERGGVGHRIWSVIV